MNMDSKKAALTFQRDSFNKDRTVAMWLPVSTLHTEAELQGMNWDVATFPVYKDNPNFGPQPYQVGFFVTTSALMEAEEALNKIIQDKKNTQK